MDETIHQFRQFLYRMDYPTETNLDNGCTCPACFQVIFQKLLRLKKKLCSITLQGLMWVSTLSVLKTNKQK